MKAKTIHRLKVAVAILLAILIFLFAVLTFFVIAMFTVDGDARVLPSYARENLDPILAKERSEWTEDDYNTLSLQTGVFARDILEGLTNERILSFQEALFFAGEVRHDAVAFTTPHDLLWDPEADKAYVAPIVDLQPGDILLTSTCHTFGWRNGHASLILSNDRILQSFTLGSISEAGRITLSNGAPWFQRAANFMVLRLKDADAETRKAIADEAEKNLLDIPYSLTVGIFSSKDQGTSPTGTNCSHLVWQAYKNAGYDIDYDGGPVCTTRDIANSPFLEVVQVYGFDPIKLW